MTNNTISPSSQCHIFLTGQPSVGKTTIIKSIIDVCLGQNETRMKDQDKPLVSTAVSTSNNASAKGLSRPVRLSGFYTEETRGPSGDRMGFDIISYNHHTNSRNDDNDVTKTDCGCPTSVESRDLLSRAVAKIKKGDPSVGKYLVNIDNVDRLAVASLTRMANRLKQTKTSSSQKSSSEYPEVDIGTATDTNNILEVCVLDEVGKMEMLCPTFIPAVHDILDTISHYNKLDNDGRNNDKNNTNSFSMKCILFGTIPTPRYGRVIPEVESIRARKDVLALHVTKQNREELRERLISLVQHVMHGREAGENSDLNSVFQGYMYDRPLGSGSMSKPNVKNNEKSTNGDTTISVEEGKSETNIATLIPCGPLLDEKSPPKVLILGHTASAKPLDESLSYCERSMWTILGKIFNIPFSPVKNVEKITPPESDNYRALVKITLEHGICIWDVLSNVHSNQTHYKLRRGKRKATTSNDATFEPPKPNDIQSLIQKYQSVSTTCFIGAKAYNEFQTLFKESEEIQTLELCVLPSSSPANCRISLDEKVKQWQDAILKAGVLLE